MHVYNGRFHSLVSGTINPSWRKSYFALKGTKLLYTKQEGDNLAKPEGEVDLTSARGVRSKEECAKTVQWPDDIKEEQCFGVAVETGTYYLIGTDEENVKYASDVL